MAFRGFGDDALKVKSDRREAALKAAQIAASERASMRSAEVAIRGQEENARQADMADARAGAQFDASENARVDNMNFQREHLADTIVSGEENRAANERTTQVDQGLKQQGMDLRRQQAEQQDKNQRFDQAVKIAGVEQNERQLQMNEEIFAKTQAEAQKQQDAQDEMNQVGTAAQLAALRAAVVATGPLPMVFINSINDANGVEYGAPGSVTMIMPVTDQETKARLGVGVRKIGKDGKPVDSILDPMTIAPKLRASMSPESWMQLVGDVTTGQRSKGNDRTTVGFGQEHVKFDKDRAAALVAEHSRLATESSPTGTMLRDDVESTKTTMANIIKELHAELGLIETDSVDDTQTEKRYTPEESQSLEPGTIYMGTDGRKYKR